jgi:hypothetical protein
MARMGPREIIGRARQEVSKRVDRAAGGAAAHPDIGELEAAMKAFPAKRFFPGTTDPSVPGLLTDRFPEWAATTVAIADDVLQGVFPLFGGRRFSLGQPVDWHVDPLTRRRSPAVHWTSLDPLDETLVGDSKGVWEVNRHQWMVQLAQAYRLTGREEYPESVVRHLAEWRHANPPGVGINWASSLEVGYRLMSWCWALFLLRDSRALSRPEVLADVFGSLWRHAAHVDRYLSIYFSPNTHLTGEALALVYAGVLFPEFRAARRWLRLGIDVLAHESRRQILSDGVYFEQATCYQLYTADIYSHLILLGTVGGFDVPADLRERLQRLVDFLVAIRRPDGSIPEIGDDDGGALPPVGSARPRDFRPMFSTAAALFERSDYAWAADGLAPETVWLMGARAARLVDGLSAAPPPARRSSEFNEGGYVILRNGWDRDAHQLIFDVGPLDRGNGAAHGHADLLSVQCAAFGQTFIVDPGTFTYTADRAARDFFRSTAAHSTVTVDGRPQAEPNGPFGWKRRPRARLRSHQMMDTLDVVDADHGAYTVLPDPVHHRRRVIFVRQQFWVIVDDLDGRDEHRVDVRFQFAGVAVMAEGPWVRARGGGRALVLRSLATVPTKCDLLEGEEQPPQGWISDGYGTRRAAPAVVYTAEARLPLRLVTVLIPLHDEWAAPPDVSPIDGETRIAGVRVGQECIMLTPADGLRGQRT